MSSSISGCVHPIVTDHASLAPQTCLCEDGCAKCAFEFSINVSLSRTDEARNVTTADLVPIAVDGNSHIRVFPVR